MSLPTPTVLVKKSSWTRIYHFDFGDFAELLAGQGIVTSSVSVTATPSGLTIGSPSVSGSIVQVQLSSGQPGVQYELTCSITTTSGMILSQQGLLSVE